MNMLIYLSYSHPLTQHKLMMWNAMKNIITFLSAATIQLLNIIRWRYKIVMKLPIKIECILHYYFRFFLFILSLLPTPGYGGLKRDTKTNQQFEFNMSSNESIYYPPKRFNALFQEWKKKIKLLKMRRKIWMRWELFIENVFWMNEFKCCHRLDVLRFIFFFPVPSFRFFHHILCVFNLCRFQICSMLLEQKKIKFMFLLFLPKLNEMLWRLTLKFGAKNETYICPCSFFFFFESSLLVKKEEEKQNTKNGTAIYLKYVERKAII